MSDEKKAALEKMAALQEILQQFSGVSVKVQCERLLAALRKFPLTTFEAMRWLDIYYPPARIAELRADGHNIVTHWQTVITEAGEKHRVGLYLLMTGGSDA